MSEASINSRLKIDAAHQIRLMISSLYNRVLRDYIAYTNEREVLDNLYKFYTESDFILISKQQLRVYQEIENQSLSLSTFNTKKDK